MLIQHAGGPERYQFDANVIIISPVFVMAGHFRTDIYGFTKLTSQWDSKP